MAVELIRVPGTVGYAPTKERRACTPPLAYKSHDLQNLQKIGPVCRWHHKWVGRAPLRVVEMPPATHRLVSCEDFSHKLFQSSRRLLERLRPHCRPRQWFRPRGLYRSTARTRRRSKSTPQRRSLDNVDVSTLPLSRASDFLFDSELVNPVKELCHNYSLAYSKIRR